MDLGPTGQSYFFFSVDPGDLSLPRISNQSTFKKTAKAIGFFHHSKLEAAKVSLVGELPVYERVRQEIAT